MCMNFFRILLLLLIGRKRNCDMCLYACVCSSKRQAGPGLHPDSLSVGAQTLSLVLKRPVREDHSPIPLAEVMNAWTEISTLICLHGVMPCLAYGQCCFYLYVEEHHFIWLLSFAASCQLVYRVNVAHLAKHLHARRSNCEKGQCVLSDKIRNLCDVMSFVLR